jgi:mono/diheme cytochrome c family protein
MGLTAVVTMAMGGILVSSVAAQEQEVIGGGRYLYEKFCKICHGPRALGNGPKAPSLQPKPANLTTLRQRNGGTFPFWEAYRMIDGRVDVPGHGTRDMPVFGVWFRIPDDEVSIETEWGDQVRGRIWQLLSYLKSIQVP